MNNIINGNVLHFSEESKVYFTLFRSNKLVVKKYKADFTKTIAANMYRADYILQNVSNLKELDMYFNSLSSFDTITLGLTSKTAGLSLTSQDFKNGKDCIFRGKEHIKYCNDIYPDVLSLLFIDIDWDEKMPKHFLLDTPKNVRDSLIKLYPILSSVGMLIRASSSSGIYNTQTNEKRSLYNSWHVYFIVSNSTEKSNKDFIEYTKRRAWRDDVNLGYAKTTKVSVLERYYIDLAVNSPERIIVESLPMLDFPLKKEPIQSTVYDGGVLDLSSIDYTVEPDYRDKFAHEKSLLTSSTSKDNSSKNPLHNNIQVITKEFYDGEISIDMDTQNKITKINKYLNNSTSSYVKYDEIKKYLNDKVTSAFLTFLGFEIDSNMKFKIRDEKTSSASINFDGYIKDFGTDGFAGNLASFLIEIYNLKFIEAWNYIKVCFGKSAILSPKTLIALPDASAFFKKLYINN